MKFELANILKIQKDLQKDLPLEENLSRILKDFEKKIKFQSLGIFLKVPRTDLYRLKISRNISHSFAKNTIFTQADPLLEELSKFDPIENIGLGFFKLEFDYSHLIINPIYFKDKLFGFFFIDLADGSFSEEEIIQMNFYTSLISMIVQIHLLEEEVHHHKGLYDITKVYNYKTFIHRTDALLELMKRYNRDFCIAILTIDNFNNLVRSVGKYKIHEIMQEIAYCIKGNLRNTDIIGQIHENSFAIALPETSKKNTENTIKRIDERLTQTIEINKITRGWGICEYDEKKNDIIALIKHSENAAFEAVRKEKNIEVY
ncbi:MAG: diguanylate cyclase [Candidatus Cloacimonetes bacterium]|nr:diguanylate cyclase [Candidatus Cloacimonadota bacterium]